MGLTVKGGVVEQTVIGPAGRAMAAGDWAWVAGWLCGRFGVDVGPEFVEYHNATRQASRAFGVVLSDGWSDGSWAMWWKNRLEAAGLFPHLGRDPLPVHLDVELHTGQIGRYASPEEMAELETMELPDYYQDTTATPGIERTQEMPTPIDRTAARVTGYRQEDNG